jgi:hypothetical protein
MAAAVATSPPIWLFLAFLLRGSGPLLLHTSCFAPACLTPLSLPAFLECCPTLTRTLPLLAGPHSPVLRIGCGCDPSATLFCFGFCGGVPGSLAKCRLCNASANWPAFCLPACLPVLQWERDLTPLDEEAVRKMLGLPPKVRRSPHCFCFLPAALARSSLTGACCAFLCCSAAAGAGPAAKGMCRSPDLEVLGGPGWSCSQELPMLWFEWGGSAQILYEAGSRIIQGHQERIKIPTSLADPWEYLKPWESLEKVPWIPSDL